MRFLTLRAFAIAGLLVLLFIADNPPANAHMAGSPSGGGVFFVTGYVCPPYCGLTFSGTQVRLGVVAVDPNVIPLGSKVEIDNIGTFIAEDTGGAVKGYHIDVFVGSRAEAYALTGNYSARWYQDGAEEGATGKIVISRVELATHTADH